MTRRRDAGRFLALALLAVALVGATPVMAQDDWRLPGLAGGPLTQADVAKGTTVMVVWASWSPHCRDVVERSNRLAAKWAGRAKVVLVDFQEDAGEVSAYLAGKGAQTSTYLDADGSFAKLHQVTTLPGLVVYRDGAVVYQGRLPDDPDKVVAESVQ
jgi:thiol-disulfide isomerase/thioredoxin